jgi:hypothetical protein
MVRRKRRKRMKTMMESGVLSIRKPLMKAVLKNGAVLAEIKKRKMLSQEVHQNPTVQESGDVLTMILIMLKVKSIHLSLRS